ncbi:unnamed protein product [Protopolystoma xenopodis]|uniref:NR LBD domain-containing protein n=1 Tax=Protopolystoma xenopodis TaxID=117903 RepID=A0A3S5FBP0_9PLAT|nr:unnamed protein product [Protopolystoma xenopodis]
MLVYFLINFLVPLRLLSAVQEERQHQLATSANSTAVTSSSLNTSVSAPTGSSVDTTKLIGPRHIVNRGPIERSSSTSSSSSSPSSSSSTSAPSTSPVSVSAGGSSVSPTRSTSQPNVFPHPAAVGGPSLPNGILSRSALSSSTPGPPITIAPTCFTPISSPASTTLSSVASVSSDAAVSDSVPHILRITPCYKTSDCSSSSSSSSSCASQLSSNASFVNISAQSSTTPTSITVALRTPNISESTKMMPVTRVINQPNWSLPQDQLPNISPRYAYSSSFNCPISSPVVGEEKEEEEPDCLMALLMRIRDAELHWLTQISRPLALPPRLNQFQSGFKDSNTASSGANTSLRPHSCNESGSYKSEAQTLPQTPTLSTGPNLPSSFRHLKRHYLCLLHELVVWARALPWFSDLSNHDQLILLQSGWIELLLAQLAYRLSLDTSEPGSLTASSSAVSNIVRPGYFSLLGSEIGMATNAPERRLLLSLLAVDEADLVALLRHNRRLHLRLKRPLPHLRQDGKTVNILSSLTSKSTLKPELECRVGGGENENKMTISNMVGESKHACWSEKRKSDEVSMKLAKRTPECGSGDALADRSTFSPSRSLSRSRSRSPPAANRDQHHFPYRQQLEASESRQNFDDQVTPQRLMACLLSGGEPGEAEFPLPVGSTAHPQLGSKFNWPRFQSDVVVSTTTTTSSGSCLPSGQSSYTSGVTSLPSESTCSEGSSPSLKNPPSSSVDLFQPCPLMRLIQQHHQQSSLVSRSVAPCEPLSGQSSPRGPLCTASSCDRRPAVQLEQPQRQPNSLAGSAIASSRYEASGTIESDKWTALQAAFDQFMTDVATKLYDLRVDATEIGCIRVIVLLNPGEGRGS